ncbi:hypothetical protein BDA99DRAFT_494444 [Phascolomyces articulosus]|uniref:ATPase inhibitor n=1 Tax=Phascolomyces articulosus TaxID=60185 RepID=A0AAD5KPD0_9FUNG|nr:hypothetical protein BDA99DRAFT_494444 [Phascolomyces articulosus]
MKLHPFSSINKDHPYIFSVPFPFSFSSIILTFFYKKTKTMIARQAATLSKRTITPLSRRMISSTRTVAEEGGTKKLSEKEQAAEKQFARQRDEEKLKALRKALEEQEKTTNQLKKDLEALEKGQ